MNEEVLQAAAQTFCLVPEVYAQAFKQAGADFPDELVAQIKKQPEQAMQMLKEDQELFKGVVTIYSQYKDQIDQAAAKATQQTGLFKKGGKLEQLLVKAQDGAIIPGQEYFKVHPLKQGWWDSLFNSPTNKLPNEPGIGRRTLDIAVDPKTGEQRYTLHEDVYGNTADTDFMIQPGDTVVNQKIATRDGYAKRQYLQDDPKYRQVIDRLLRTGAVDFVNRNFPATNKK